MLCLAAALLLQLPEPLETALSRETQAGEFQAGHIRVSEGEARIEFRVEYDAGGEAQLTLLAPDEAALSEAEAELWESWQGEDEEEENDEGPRTFGHYSSQALRASIGESARLEREEAGLLIYSFAPQTLVGPEGETDANGMLEYLTGTVAVDPAAGHVAWIEYAAAESFKPNMAARIERLSMRTDYTGSEAGLRLARMAVSVAGSAAFRAFEQSTVIELLEAEFAPAD